MLKSRIVANLQRTEFGRFILENLRNRKNKDFRDYVNNYASRDILWIHHPGKEMPDKNIYCIKNRGNAGFFSEMTITLQCLRFAEIFHLIPVVCWDKEGFYVEKSLVDGKRNSFEYFFEAVSDIASEAVLNYENVIFSVPTHRFNTNMVRDDGNEAKDNFRKVDELGKLYAKYCRRNPKTQEYIDGNLKKKLHGKRTLGVHIRGTDYKQCLSYHPVRINAGDFVKPAKELMLKHGYEQIFLATDSLEAIKLFESEFGEQLVFYEDISRSDGDVGLHVMENNRENHHYLLGLEVLRDAYTLAACDSLLAGMSNVSLAAQYIKIANGTKHEDVKILDHGVHGRKL